MIFRCLIKCNSCNENVVLRVSLPLAKTEGFLLPCPECQVALRGKMSIDYETPTVKILSEDFEVDSGYDAAKAEGCEVVTISTDLPIHRTRHKKNLIEGGSPFLWLHKLLGSEKFIEHKKLIDSLNLLREKQFNNFKVAISYAETYQWNRVSKVVNRIAPIKGYYNTKTENAIYSFYRTLTIFYAPLISLQEMLDIYDESYQHINKCLKNKRKIYSNLLTEFKQLYGYEEYRNKVLGCYYRTLQNFDSYIAGIVYDYMPDDIKPNLEDYRVFRDDYELVKSLYVDIFKCVSMMLFYLGSIVNLSQRNTSYNFFNGINNAKNFRKGKAYDKLKILDELPALKKLIEKVSRPMRNDIGHFNASYNFREGVLTYEDGSKTNYIIFLNHLLSAVKAMWFLISINEKIDLDMVRLKI